MTSPSLLDFFLQGFHLHTHTVQTVVTLVLLAGVLGFIGTTLHFPAY